MITLTKENIIGLIAGALTTFSFIPQVKESYNLMINKKKSDVSIMFMSIILVGMVFWAYYGILVNKKHNKSRPGDTIILWNSISIIFVSLVIIFTLQK
jgi:uncharacterized protein with PQ loop repeat